MTPPAKPTSDSRLWDRLPTFCRDAPADTSRTIQHRPARWLHGVRDLLSALKTPKDTTREDARKAVKEALASGALVKPKTCERCGWKPQQNLLHGHHPDYTKPLQVVWL